MVRSTYKDWIRPKFWNSTWYQNYRSCRILFKILRTRFGWYRSIVKWRIRPFERIYLKLRSDSAPGSPEWLIETEIKYGGKILGEFLSIQKSPYDSHGSDDLAVGGDRMLHHGYANSYARFLDPYVQNRSERIVICEVGILEGTGLAIWCDLFPNARCIGLDIDLSNVRRNMDNLRHFGAFGENSPELFEYDQFVYSAEFINQILNGERINIFVDDGHHSEQAIMTTLKSVAPYLSERFVYFVEDNLDIHEVIRQKYLEWDVHSDGELTVVTSSRS